MKINRRRSAISQSMDLFIIIAAVLGVGGVVSASVYNLVNSASSNASVSVVGASVRAGSLVAASPTAISLSIKNNGGTPISCAGTSCQVIFAGTNVGTAAPACSGSCSLISGGPATWSLGGANGPLAFLAGSATIAPGQEASFVLNGAITTTGGSFWTAGTPVTINVLFGPASAQVTVISQ